MSERVSIGGVEDRKLKRKIKEEHFTPSKSQRVGGDSGSSPKPINPSNDQVHEENQFSCIFCNKKFANAQGLGGHQNAHKKERILLNMKKEIENNPFEFRPKNVDLYPYSLSSISNLPSQQTPFYHGAHMHRNPMGHMPNMSFTLAPPDHGTNQGFSFAPHNFRMTSSWGGGAATSPWRLNPQTGGLWQQIPSPADSASKSLVGGSSSRVDPGFGGLTLQESPNVSNNDSPSADLDLSLKL